MDRSTKPKITSIVLTWNSAEFINKCICSLQKSKTYTDILLIDNDSRDSTRQIISRDFPTVKLVNTGSNLGYAGGNNFGIKLALKTNPDYIFILNPDAYIAPDCIEKLVTRAESDKRTGIISPFIYNSSDSKIAFAGSTINWLTGESPHLGIGQIDRGQYSSNKYAERANGCAMLIRSTALKKVGLMDEKYFLYYEETDWSMIFRQNGYKIGMVPEAKVWHKKSSSTGGYLSNLSQYYQTRNRLIFMNKFRPKYKAFILVSVAECTLRSLLVFKKTRSFHEIHLAISTMTKAHVDYFKCRFGKQTD